MADVKISALKNVDPLRSGMLFPVSYNKAEDGSPLGMWKSGRISSDQMHNYLAPLILEHIETVEGEISFEPICDDDGNPTGNYLLKHDADTGLFEIVSSVDTNGYPVVDPKDGPVKNKIYLVQSNAEDGTDESIYTEWHWDGENWAMFGKYKARTDLENYYDKDTIDAKLNAISGSADSEYSLAGLGSRVDTIEATVGNSGSGLVKNVEELQTKVSTLETASSKHALATDLATTNANVEGNLNAITALAEKIGTRNDGVAPTGSILREIDDIKATHASDKTTLEESISEVESSIESLASQSDLDGLEATVDSHTTSISTINSELELRVKTADFNTYKTETATAIAEKSTKEYVDANFATKTALEAHDTAASAALEAAIADLNLDSKLANYTESTVTTALTSRVTTLEDAGYQTAAQVGTAIDTKLSTGKYATESYVDSAIADADIDGKLGDYAKSADVASTYATKDALDDVTKADGTIDSKVNSAKATLEAKLTTANETISTLQASIEALEAKLAYYDARFGWAEPVDGKVEWTKSFLLLDSDDTEPLD